jgi:hypothetical protein
LFCLALLCFPVRGVFCFGVLFCWAGVCAGLFNSFVYAFYLGELGGLCWGAFSLSCWVFSLACCTPPSTTCTICGLINFAASKIKCYVRIRDTN